MTCPSTKEDIRRIVLDAGACRVGFAAAGPVGDSTRRRYDSWIAGGRHAGMAYLGRYGDVRSDPRLLLDGAATVRSCAFDYRPSRRHPLFADYSLGEDYHDVLRSRLTAAAEVICSRYGGLTRICVDTAPIRERYWAARAGVGVIGLNGLIIVDGIGSKVFLAEILWTGEVGPDLSRLADICMNCGACVRACPGRALGGDMTLDARSCNSYLTIEHRGDLPLASTDASTAATSARTSVPTTAPQDRRPSPSLPRPTLSWLSTSTPSAAWTPVPTARYSDTAPSGAPNCPNCSATPKAENKEHFRSIGRDTIHRLSI